MTAAASQAKPDQPEAANPAPEPDTFMLLGTGAAVLLLLFYSRRRARLVAPHTPA